MNNQEKLAKIKTIVEDYFQDEYFPIDLESIGSYEMLDIMDSLMKDIKEILEA